MTLDQLKNMNATIETTKIKGKDYAMVHERIKALRSEIPNASITTEIVHLEGDTIVMKAYVIDEDGNTLGTGHAEEQRGNGNINQTSFVENCETSAVGRALGMCGIGIDKSFASADEVANAMMQGKKITPDEAEVFKTMCESRGKTPKEGYQNMTAAEYTRAIKALVAGTGNV